MQILIPLAAKSDFFPIKDYYFPKSLVDVSGKPMIEHVIRNLSSINPAAKYIFIIQDEDAIKFSLDLTLKLLAGESCEVVNLRGLTKGALCSALMACDVINIDEPLVVANGDQLIDADLSEVVGKFRQENASAGVIVFNSVHPQWSYVSINEAGNVNLAAEKRVISRNAIAGFYYFATGRIFLRAAMQCIENDSSVDGRFYTAPALNEVILDGGKVSVYEVAADRFHSFHSPDKIKQFESAGNGCGNGVSPSPPADLGTHEGNAVVVVPAAGDGSRFRTAGFLKPKPFIDVLGRPMIEHVLGNVVPAGASVHVILRRSHAESERALTKQLLDRGIGIHYVDRLTEGTACTLLLAQRAIDNDSPLLIANSDQYVDFDVSAFVRDCLDRQLDGSILIFKEPTRDTKWSYAKIDSGGLVLEVAEKKAISDLATVGIYLFRRGRDFIRGAIDMIANNDRVNNEFYTCPVYNYLIRSGARIGVFEIPKSSMHGLGTPADLAEFIQGRSHTDERPLASH